MHENKSSSKQAQNTKQSIARRQFVLVKTTYG